MRGGSATPVMWAEEAYDDALAQWEVDARAYYQSALQAKDS